MLEYHKMESAELGKLQIVSPWTLCTQPQMKSKVTHHLLFVASEWCRENELSVSFWCYFRCLDTSNTLTCSTLLNLIYLSTENNCFEIGLYLKLWKFCRFLKGVKEIIGPICLSFSLEKWQNKHIKKCDGQKNHQTMSVAMLLIYLQKFVYYLFYFLILLPVFSHHSLPHLKKKNRKGKNLLHYFVSCNHIQLEVRTNIRTTNRFSFLPEQEDLTASMEEGKPILLDQCRQWS